MELPLLRKLTPALDARGKSVRVFDGEDLAGLNPERIYVLAVENINAGTIRGMHLSGDPLAGPKVLTVTNGTIFDVLLDLREGSPSFGAGFACTLSDKDPSILRIPAGFAHGYQTLEGAVKMLYCLDEDFTPEFERGFNPSSKCLDDAWPIREPRLVSDKDASWPQIEFEKLTLKAINYK